MKYYLVGGSVRDEILGKKPKDLDYAVEAESFSDMRADLLKRGAAIFQERPEFGVIRARLGKEVADFTLCRKDGFYSDGRHPDSIETGTIYDDLSRRDFTINAIAKYDNKYIDPYNGINDINFRVITCVNNTEERFTEDALRMLRALRFSVTLGFQLSFSIRKFLDNQQNVLLLENVSTERIREELFKMYSYDTLRTIRVLHLYPDLEDFLFREYSGRIWLKPTMEE